MPLLIAVLAFLLLTGTISLYGYRIYSRPGRVAERLRDEAPAPVGRSAPATRSPRVLVQMIQQIGEQVPADPADLGLARRQLIAAGYRSDQAPVVVNGLKVIALVLLTALAFLFGGKLSSAMVMRVGLIGAAGFVGWSLPGMVLDSLIGRRHERLRFSLPDALDLMVVCVEGGLGLDQALVAVTRDLRLTHPEICDELGLVTLEMQAGKRRAEALQNLGERTGEPELKKLVAVLVQADRFGTGIAESLRVHGDFMRVRRRQEAESRAAKVGVKLVFPIFFFILPAIMIVTAGPGILQVFKSLLPMMRGGGQ